MTQGKPLPRVGLVLPMTDCHNDDERAACKLRTTVAFILGMEGGPEGEGMPRDVFRVVLDMLMPVWDPLRRNTDVSPSQQG